MFDFFFTYLRYLKFRRQFKNSKDLKGLNPDKHDQVIKSHFYVEEHGLTFKVDKSKIVTK